VSSADQLPRYIERGGEQVPPHPYRLYDVSLTAFSFRVDPERIAALCDRQLNPLCDARYRPALPIAVAYFAASPMTEAADGRGTTPERELAVWVPLRAERPRRTVWFCPYIFVDSTYPLLSGRDIYGFPKSLARFELPRACDPPLRYAATVTGWSPPRSHAPAHEFELLAVEAQSPCARAWSLRSGWRRPIAGLAADALARLGSSTTSVSLKQVRDVEFPDRACYQAVVESGFRVLRVHDAAALRGDYLLQVSPSTSYPIIEDLGLPEHGQVSVLAGLWLRFDVESMCGVVLGERSADRRNVSR
jgi:hypothetical protein